MCTRLAIVGALGFLSFSAPGFAQGHAASASLDWIPGTDVDADAGLVAERRICLNPGAYVLAGELPLSDLGFGNIETIDAVGGAAIWPAGQMPPASAQGSMASPTQLFLMRTPDDPASGTGWLVFTVRESQCYDVRARSAKVRFFGLRVGVTW